MGGWQWAFFINLPLGAISLWRGARWFQKSRNPDNGAPLDIVGVTLLAAGVGAIALGLVRSEALGWSSPMVLSFVGFGVVALGAFIPWAQRPPRRPSIFRCSTTALIASSTWRR